MSEYINCLIDLYNNEKNDEDSKSYIKSVKELLIFYGIDINK